jgi:hypothetical protein
LVEWSADFVSTEPRTVSERLASVLFAADTASAFGADLRERAASVDETASGT